MIFCNVTREDILRSEENFPLYHLSAINLDGQTVFPSIPQNFFTKNNFEENETKRICFSTSINGCLKGLSQNIEGKEFFVHVPEGKFFVFTPSQKYVPDAGITQEKWVMNPVRMFCIGKIKVLRARKNGKRFSFHVLPGKEAKEGFSSEEEYYAFLYEWKWEWEWQRNF